MHRYSSSLIKALQSIYSEHSWEILKFHQIPKGYWKDINNQKKFLDTISKDLRLKTLDDWYEIPMKDLQDRIGFRLLSMYWGSLIQALQTIYPDHPWDITKLHKVSKGYWNDINNQRKLFDSIGRRIGIERLDDWYNVRTTIIEKTKLSSILSYNYSFSLIKALQTIYPEHPWDIIKVSASSKRILE